MKFRFFRETRWFSIYVERRGIFSSGTGNAFYERRYQGGDHEIWVGHFYLTFRIYSQQNTASA